MTTIKIATSRYILRHLLQKRAQSAPETIKPSPKKIESPIKAPGSEGIKRVQEIPESERISASQAVYKTYAEPDGNGPRLFNRPLSPEDSVKGPRVDRSGYHPTPLIFNSDDARRQLINPASGVGKQITRVAEEGGGGMPVAAYMRIPGGKILKGDRAVIMSENSGADTPFTYAHESAHAADPLVEEVVQGRARELMGGRLEPEIPAIAVESAYAQQHGMATPQSIADRNANTVYAPWVYKHMAKYGPQFSTDDPQLSRQDHQQIQRFMADIRGETPTGRGYTNFMRQTGRAFDAKTQGNEQVLAEASALSEAERVLRRRPKTRQLALELKRVEYQKQLALERQQVEQQKQQVAAQLADRESKRKQRAAELARMRAR